MTGIFYGSTTGTTAELAKDIAAELGVAAADIHDIASAAAGDVQKYDLIVLGSSTWGYGDLQDDWEGFLPKLKGENLSGKRVALFGTGDSESYPDTFCDAMGIIREELASTGCAFVGEYPADGYAVSGSRAFSGDRMLGLAVDDINESDRTAERMAMWVAAVTK